MINIVLTQVPEEPMTLFQQYSYQSIHEQNFVMTNEKEYELRDILENKWPVLFKDFKVHKDVNF